MKSLTIRILAICVLLVGCGAAGDGDHLGSPTGALPQATDLSTGSTTPATVWDGTSIVVELKAPGWTPIHLERNRPAGPPIAADVRVYVLHTKSSVFTVHAEKSSEPQEVSTSQVVDLGAGARQRAIATANATYILTQSSGPEAELEQVTAALASIHSFDVVADEIRSQDSILSVESASLSTSTVGAGYALDYSNGSTTITLAANPIVPGTALAFSDPLAGLVPLRIVNGEEAVLETSASDSPPQLHWIQGGVLISLVAPAALVGGLQQYVVRAGAVTFDQVDRSINDSLLGSSAVVESEVDGILLSKHLDSRNSGSFLCGKSVRSSSVACVPFAAVGSLAVFNLDKQWYVVAVVPTERPTTTFRTQPEVTFDTADSGGWSVSLAKIPADISSITILYSTDGVSSELSTEVSLG